MSQSDFQRKFSQEEFAAGSVRGVRAWKTPTLTRDRYAISTSLSSMFDIPVEMVGQSEPNGHLTGQYGYAWTAGENTAKCDRKEQDQLGVMIDHMAAVIAWQNSGQRGLAPTRPNPGPCEGVGASCTCGFYAYWTVDAADIGDSCNIVGVVEAYGKVTIGAKGFRAEKAKILAVAPIVNRLGDVDAALQEAMRKVAEQYPEAAVFGSVRDMLAEFPPDDPPEIDEPEPPKDDGISAFTRAWLATSTPSTTTGNHIHFQVGGRRNLSPNLYAPGAPAIPSIQGISAGPPIFDEIHWSRDPWWARAIDSVLDFVADWWPVIAMVAFLIAAQVAVFLAAT